MPNHYLPSGLADLCSVPTSPEVPKQVTLSGRAPFLRLLIPETGPVTKRLRVREIDDDEGRRLLRSSAGAVGRW